MKKSMFFALAALGLVAMASCKKEEEKTPEAAPELTNETQITGIPFTGGEFTYEFDSNKKWTVAGDAEVTIEGQTYEFGLNPTSGDAGHGVVTVTVPANKGAKEISYSFTLTLLGEDKDTKPLTKTVSLTIPAPSVTDAAGNTYKAAYLGGNYWMTENLRTIPEGMTVSEDPKDKSGLWYPYILTDVEIYSEKNKVGLDVLKSKATAKVAKDEATIKTNGYLYSANVYLGGVEFGETNFTSFEGVRGICPEGWHIPTRADFVALNGWAQASAAAGFSEVLDDKAPFYDATYKGGKYENAVKSNWNPVLTGTVTGAYSTTVITKLNSTKSELFNKQALTYWAGSTGNSKTQVWAMITTFTKDKYPEGRLHTSFCTASFGVAVRCVMDKTAK